MPHTKILIISVLVLPLISVILVNAETQNTDTTIIPDSHKGLHITSLGVLPENSLKAQIGLSGYKMQLREITIEPGGQIGKHDHFKKPGLVWTTEGIIQEGRQDNTIRAYPYTLKEAMLEDKETVHWFRNTTDQTARMVVCDIIPSQ